MSGQKFPNIKLRLLSGLFILLFISTSLSFFYFKDSRNMYTVSEDIIRHPYTVSNSVRDIAMNIYAMHRSMKDVALAENEQQLNRAIQMVNTYEKRVHQKFDLVFERFLGSPKTVSAAYETFIVWKPIRDEVINLVKEKKYAEASEITREKGAKHVQLLIYNTNLMIEFANNKAKTFTADSLKILKSAQKKAIALSGFSLFLGIFIFFRVFQGINKPLEKIINRIKRVSDIELTSDIPENERNKLVLLDFAVRGFENRNEFLKKGIQEKTLELQEARDLLEQSIDNAPIGMAKTGLDGRLQSVNHSLCQMLGYDQNELQGKFIQDITHKEDRTISDEFAIKVISERKTNKSLEKRCIHKQGSVVFVSVTSSLVKDARDNPRYLFTQIKDITVQKKHEQELEGYKAHLEELVADRTRKLKDKTYNLERSQKALSFLLEDVNEMSEKLKHSNTKLHLVNEELKAFSYSVSHDLKTPLRAIEGFTRMLLEDHSDKLDQDARKLTRVIIENTVKMRQLIDSILALSRLGRKNLKITTFNSDELIEELRKDFEDKTGTGNVKWIVSPLPEITGDQGMIKQLFVNLISNAIKFTSNRKNPVISISHYTENHENVFCVRDNGVGFDMKYAHKIFEVFQRLHTEEEFSGTGIGLAIVRRIVHRHGGEIRAKGKKNEGATISFTLGLK